MFATACGQWACQAQAAWLCDASATAKHHLISCRKWREGIRNSKLPGVRSGPSEILLFCYAAMLLPFCCSAMLLLDLEAGYCLTSLSEATRKALGKRPECRKSLRRRRRGAVEARRLPPECRTACGKGATRDLEAGYCLTLRSEATRKALGKRPEYRKSLRRRRRGAVEARLLLPECSNSLWQGCREGFGGRLLPNVAFWSH